MGAVASAPSWSILCTIADRVSAGWTAIRRLSMRTVFTSMSVAFSILAMLRSTPHVVPTCWYPPLRVRLESTPAVLEISNHGYYRIGGERSRRLCRHQRDDDCRTASLWHRCTDAASPSQSRLARCPKYSVPFGAPHGQRHRRAAACLRNRSLAVQRRRQLERRRPALQHRLRVRRHRLARSRPVGGNLEHHRHRGSDLSQPGGEDLQYQFGKSRDSGQHRLICYAQFQRYGQYQAGRRPPQSRRHALAHPGSAHYPDFSGRNHQQGL